MRLCKSSLLTKIVILAVMVFATVTVVTLQTKKAQTQAADRALAQQIEAAEQTNLELQEAIEHCDSDEAIKEIARERLNLVEDGEMIFVDSNN